MEFGYGQKHGYVKTLHTHQCEVTDLVWNQLAPGQLCLRLTWSQVNSVLSTLEAIPAGGISVVFAASEALLKNADQPKRALLPFHEVYYITQWLKEGRALFSSASWSASPGAYPQPSYEEAWGRN
ncbi:uncharacterized protein LOC110983823 isoform X2 [Acanthaster planci]|uniref:Uncharacterized protein LOC110983823 isoform X2 n=1 Tax=Acanthaster planci TaxID=133434 RepID=A0A8B7Z296_ACAPL|nr:uncharacterized protein LOC110983823 isoform X2 [Acanthaster planci]